MGVNVHGLDLLVRKVLLDFRLRRSADLQVLLRTRRQPMVVVNLRLDLGLLERLLLMLLHILNI